MEITDVRISLMDDSKLRAFASITIDDCFVVRGLKIIKTPRTVFVAMPSRRLQNGSFQDIAHPINRETRQKLESVVLQAYDDARRAEGPGISQVTTAGN
jgi:stage V sporulation protein G